MTWLITKQTVERQNATLGTAADSHEYRWWCTLIKNQFSQYSQQNTNNHCSIVVSKFSYLLLYVFVKMMRYCLANWNS